MAVNRTEQEIDKVLTESYLVGKAELERAIPFLKKHDTELRELEESKVKKVCIAHISIHPKLCTASGEVLNAMRLLFGYGYMLGYEKAAKELYEEFICPICYRLNPHHATANKGKGCQSCQDKEDYCGKEAVDDS